MDGWMDASKEDEKEKREEIRNKAWKEEIQQVEGKERNAEEKRREVME